MTCKSKFFVDSSDVLINRYQESVELVFLRVPDRSKMLEIPNPILIILRIDLIMKIIVTSIQLNSKLTKKTVTQIYLQKF